MRPLLAILLLVSFLAKVTSPQSTALVVSVRTTSESQYIPANGQSPAITVNHPVCIYRIELQTEFLELREYCRKPAFAIGEAISLTIEPDRKHGSVRIASERKARRMSVVAEELKRAS